MSLSPVEISTSKPAAAPCKARVPMTSSASTPGTRSSASPMADTVSYRGCTCERRSSGMGGRCALYCSNKSSRKVRPGASNTTAMRSGVSSLIILFSMLSTPSTAPVGSPLELLSGGSA